MSEEDIKQFKQETSEILHTRYHIQCLYEEDFISSIVDKVSQYPHPKLKNDFMDMLGRNIPENHPSFPDATLYHKLVRTARALQFADSYRELLDQQDDPSPYLNNNKIHGEIAYKTLNEVYNKRKDISENPDSFIFQEQRTGKIIPGRWKRELRLDMPLR